MTERQTIGTPYDQPAVAGKSSNRSVWIFGGILAIVVVAMFSGLENRRAAKDNLSLKEPTERGETLIASAPQLSIPPDWNGQPPPEAYRRNPPYGPLLSSGEPPFMVKRAVSRVGRDNGLWKSGLPAPAQAGYGVEPPVRPMDLPPGVPTPEVVYNQGSAGANAPPPIASSSSDRVEAHHFLNPATTVPKGTVIMAVLESALDSTRAGFARAIISRDVFSFDGSKVLVPKGSRLIGEYKADLALGQKRALIQWQRLVRPDGVVVNLDSPSADPLGRAGVEGKVNSHFLARFGGSILQSALDVGVQVAASSLSSGTTILAVPGFVTGQSQGGGGNALPGQEKVQPTLTVKQGTSVSVFVARDLDFTSVE